MSLGNGVKSFQSDHPFAFPKINSGFFSFTSSYDFLADVVFASSLNVAACICVIKNYLRGLLTTLSDVVFSFFAHKVRSVETKNVVDSSLSESYT